jgi:uncharacterized protein DUF2752
MKKLDSNLTIALTSAAILIVSGITRANSGSVILAGVPLPPVCIFKLLTTFDCPGCGLTRALILAAHGHFGQSYYMHIWGIPLLFLLLFQIPYRLFRYWHPRWTPPAFPVMVKKWVSQAVFLSFLMPWAAKTAALLIVQYL